MDIVDSMDIDSPEKCRNPNKNTQTGRIGSSGKRAVLMQRSDGAAL